MRSLLIVPREAAVREQLIKTDGNVRTQELHIRELLGGHVFAWGYTFENNDELLVDRDAPSKDDQALFWIGDQKFAGVGVVVGKHDGDGLTPALSTVEAMAALVRFTNGAGQ